MARRATRHYHDDMCDRVWTVIRNVVLLSTLLAFRGPAFAVTRAPAPPPSFDGWTGFYLGGNLGYGWANPGVDTTGNAMTISPLGGRPFPNSIAFAGSHTAELDGFVGGGQVGYNYQISPRWLVGFETDIQGSAERGTDIFTDAFSAPFCIAIAGPPIHCTTTPFNGTATTDYQAKILWFGTVRGRLGALVTDRVLVYATGGLAYGRVKVAGSTSVDGLLGGGSILQPGTSAFSAERTNVGFAVGGGIEGKIFANWTWKLEYLHLNLGSLDSVTTFPPIVVRGGATPAVGTMTTHTEFTDDIVRVGLNYKFAR
jgi:outer membrane immunogenic protein